MSDRTAFRPNTWVAITPGSNKIDNIPESLLVTVAGNISMEDVNGTVVTFAVDVGPLPYRPTKILSPATTATVYALY